MQTMFSALSALRLCVHEALPFSEEMEREVNGPAGLLGFSNSAVAHQPAEFSPSAPTGAYARPPRERRARRARPRAATFPRARARASASAPIICRVVPVISTCPCRALVAYRTMDLQSPTEARGE